MLQANMESSTTGMSHTLQMRNGQDAKGRLVVKHDTAGIYSQGLQQRCQR